MHIAQQRQRRDIASYSGDVHGELHRYFLCMKQVLKGTHNEIVPPASRTTSQSEGWKARCQHCAPSLWPFVVQVLRLVLFAYSCPLNSIPNVQANGQTSTMHEVAFNWSSKTFFKRASSALKHRKVLRKSSLVARRISTPRKIEKKKKRKIKCSQSNANRNAKIRRSWLASGLTKSSGVHWPPHCGLLRLNCGNVLGSTHSCRSKLLPTRQTCVTTSPGKSKNKFDIPEPQNISVVKISAFLRIALRNLRCDD